MPTYVTLASWTDQGIRNVKDSLSRAKEGEEVMGKLGVRLRSVLWTVGPYDLVTVADADDEESAAAANRRWIRGQHTEDHHAPSTPTR
jgi:uncharacterized protein with GYD domain